MIDQSRFMEHPEIRHKFRNIMALAVAELFVMSLWFSASAVIPQLTSQWGLGGSQKALLTISVQLGFVVGAFASAIFNLADRVDNRRLFVWGAFTGALLNSAIAFFDTSVNTALVLRFLTGVSLSGVYPPGMKLIATWCREDLGFGIGLLIGALTLGSALPHLLNAVPVFGSGGMPPWQLVLYAASIMAAAAGLIVAFLVDSGPYLKKVAPFNWKFVIRTFTYRPTRLATLGYLGHMWELYAVWAWVPIFIIASFKNAGWSVTSARLAGFGSVAIGSLGCLIAGAVADRVGRTSTTIASLVVSGSCCMVSGFLFSSPAMLTAVCLIWGFAVVADSAQFSAALSELSDPRYVGTALTVQTSVGFLLTLVTIWIIPLMLDVLGWQWVFPVLGMGPLFGIWSMLRLRAMPEATRMASGNR